MDSTSLGSLLMAVLAGKETALEVVVGRRVVQAPMFHQQLLSYKILYE